MLTEQLHTPFSEAARATGLPDEIFYSGLIENQLLQTPNGNLIVSIDQRHVSVYDLNQPDNYYFIADIRHAMERRRLHLNIQTHIPGSKRSVHKREHAIFATALFYRSWQHFCEQGERPDFFQDQWYDDSDNWSAYMTRRNNTPAGLSRGLSRAWSAQRAVSVGFNHFVQIGETDYDDELGQHSVLVEFSGFQRGEFSTNLLADKASRQFWKPYLPLQTAGNQKVFANVG